jgi:hypothetical protein
MRSSFNLARVWLPGTAASLASLAAIAACSRKDTGSALAAVNAESHWAWGDDAAQRDDFSWKYTVVGALTHQAASLFWAFCSERLFASRERPASVPAILGQSAATSALACAVDYTITPQRFTPGYELRLSRRSLVTVYVALAAGLAAGSLSLSSRRRRPALEGRSAMA